MAGAKRAITLGIEGLGHAREFGINVNGVTTESQNGALFFHVMDSVFGICFADSLILLRCLTLPAVKSHY